jgi:3-oxoacyl-[acyl-carrier-protein] synthase II
VEERRRVVITGMGVVAPNGTGVDAFWDSLVHGRSGISAVTQFDVSSYPCHVAGQAEEFDAAHYCSPKNARRMDRFSQFGVACSQMALADCRIDLQTVERSAIGVAVGSSVGGLPHAEEQHSIFMEKGLNRIHPLFSTRLFVGSCMNNICIEFGITGPCYSISTGCATGSDNIGFAFNSIRDGKANLMLAGAVEAPLSPLAFGSFCLIGILSRQNDPPYRTPKPFDRHRDGIVLSEGGAVLVLEELQHALKRGAAIYAEVAGFATTHDAYHLTQPSPNGEEAERAIRLALQDASTAPEEIEYVSAHGSATIMNDKVETHILKRIFSGNKEFLLVSSIESMIGHPLGAAGALKIAACALAMKYGLVPPTINYTDPDPDCDLNYVPNTHIRKDLKTAVCNAFSFGGKNSILVLKKFVE